MREGRNGGTLGDLSEGAFLCSSSSCDGFHPSAVFSKIFASLLALSAPFLPQIEFPVLSVTSTRGRDKEL